MAKFEQILPASGPMLDSIDDESVASGKGLVRKRVNMRPDLAGNTFANVGIKGTTKITMPVVGATAEVPAGENKVTGWCNDNENEAIIWFVWNSNQNHSIFRYYTLQDKVQRIFYSEPTLGFTGSSYIGAEVIDGRVYWNDNNDHPKGFNLNKAANYTNGTSGDAYTSEDKPFDEKIFPYIKKPPRFKPSVSYESLTKDPVDGTTIDFNNLRKKQWQVKYCYVYEDDQESVYSPISKVPLAESEITPTGNWVDEITVNNALKINVNTGTYNVKKIKVAVRDASQNNSGPFYEFTEIEKFNGTTEIIESEQAYDVYFLNNTYLESIDTAYGNAYFHNVPLAAEDFILLDGKYGAMSMPKIGYDFNEIQVNYSLSTVEEDTDFSVSSEAMASNKEYDWFDLSNVCGTQTTARMKITVTVPDKFYPNAVYRVYFKPPEVPEGNPIIGAQPEVVASYVAPNEKPDNYPKVARDALINDLVDEIDRCFSIPIRIRTGGDNNVRFDFYWSFFFVNDSEDFVREKELWEDLWREALVNYEDHIYGTITTSDYVPSFKTLKKGQYHSFSIVYNDKFGRYNIAFGDEKVYVPPADSTNLEKIVRPKITIRHQPPEWAHTYRVAYLPNNSYTYVMEVPGVEVIEGTGANGVESGYKFLKINQAILSIIDEFPDSVISAYIWQEGDRIREVGKTQSYEILKEFTRSYDVVDDTETETGFLVKADFDATIELIEIYRPNLTPQDKIFYETGDEYEVLNPGTSSRAHAGNTQNQEGSTPAILDLDFGDVYFRPRFSSQAAAGYALVEDSNLSDYYVSDGISIGRGVVRTDSEQKILKRVIKTENYIENTELNRLNIIMSGDEYYPVSEVYGDVTRILERGDTLKIYQAHKETSVYVGKNYAKDGAGGNIILNTDNVFGSDMSYEQFNGATYPRSVCAMGRLVYFFDVMTADLFRSASNGTISISKEYGYEKYFDEKARAFRNYSGEKDIILSVEPDREVIYVNFIMGSNIESIAFSEERNNQGFLFFAEFHHNSKVPENFAWYGDFMYSFVNGKLYKHGLGNVNSFYGSPRKESTIELVANQYPQLQKSFEVFSIDTDGTWSAEMEIESDNNYTNKQKTKIFPAMFKNREGVLTSSVPMNIINKNGTENIQRLYNGNKMSGNAMKISLNSSNFGIMRECKITMINQK